MQAKKRQNSMQDKNLMLRLLSRKTSRRPSKFKNRRGSKLLSPRNGTHWSIDKKELKWRLHQKKQIKRGKGALPSNSNFEGLIWNKNWSLLSCFGQVFLNSERLTGNLWRICLRNPFTAETASDIPHLPCHIIKKHPSCIFLSVVLYFGLL